MTGLDALTRTVPPPADPVDGHGDWAGVEARLGVRLPADYRLLAETYGRGEFCDYLYLRTPFGTNPHNGLEWHDGLVVWGGTMDADRLCWRPEGDPDAWPVVIVGRGTGREEHALTTSRFVEEWVTGRLRSAVLEDMEPDLAPWFNAFRPRAHRCLRLSEGSRPYGERLRILRDVLAPTLDRGSWESGDGAHGQDHFATADTDWQLTYDRSHPHQIRVSFPPGDRVAARDRLFAAVRLMGCTVLEITTVRGAPLADWDAGEDEPEAEPEAEPKAETEPQAEPLPKAEPETESE
ncbi:SMI1/KNR4 family protein [Streptomyces collinus]|uniref:SMI1/KNR4 family protein n=1 Tax=Streptomyces collinus TaxID=42684 RepID=UPI0036893DFD